MKLSFINTPPLILRPGMRYHGSRIDPRDSVLACPPWLKRRRKRASPLCILNAFIPSQRLLPEAVPRSSQNQHLLAFHRAESL